MLPKTDRIRPFILLTLAVCSVFAVCFVCGSVNADDSSTHLPGLKTVAEFEQFLGSNCMDCHHGTEASGGLNLARLLSKDDVWNDMHRWSRVWDRVAAGEMPPEEYGELDSMEKEQFIERLGDLLTRVQREHDQRHGRVPARRLTNLQLERSLQDLLGIDIPLAREIPEEPSTGSYSTLASAQTMSHYQLEQHVHAVDLALDEAFRRATQPPDQWMRDMSAKKISRTRTRCREPEFIDDAAVVWSSRLIFYGRMPATKVPESGWYRIRFSVSSVNKPPEHGVWCTVRSGLCISSAPLMEWIGSFEAHDEPREVSFEAWMPRGHMLEVRPYDQTLKLAKFQGGQAADGEGGKQNVPGIRVHNMFIERFHRGASDQEIRQSLFGDIEWQPVDKRRVLNQAIDQQAPKLIARFADRAFRRPIPPEQSDQFQQIYQARLEETNDPLVALRAAYRAILCSARFVYLHETPGKLDQYAVAARLSYFVYGSMPDERLRAAAEAGKLNDPEELRRQLGRLLDNDRGRQFMLDFASEWLELDQIDFTDPDPRLYPKFDVIVQQAMLDETHYFLQDLLDSNAPVQRLIDSKHSFLSSRLARYYGIPGIESDRIERVQLPKDSPRGGLLAQGSVLKVTANGTNTSPVMRGVWINERLLGNAIPPPPENVPAIEPDTRGATTIREQLEMHRNHAECASCHRHIDPPGFALENFDPAGGWREVYPVSDRKKKKPPVDASYLMATGEPFSDFTEFRQLISQDQERLATNWVSHLLVYATGAEISFADRQQVAGIVTAAREDGYRLRDLLESVITSPLFLSK